MEELEDLKKQCITLVQDAIRSASERYGVDIDVPPIEFSHRMYNNAGYVRYNRKTNKPLLIKFSVPLLLDNTEEFLAGTPVHEAAHVIALVVYQDASHGDNWKRIMRDLGLNPKRTHDMPIQRNRYQYYDSAGHIHRVSRKVHRQIQTYVLTDHIIVVHHEGDTVQLRPRRRLDNADKNSIILNTGTFSDPQTLRKEGDLAMASQQQEKTTPKVVSKNPVASKTTKATKTKTNTKAQGAAAKVADKAAEKPASNASRNRAWIQELKDQGKTRAEVIAMRAELIERCMLPRPCGAAGIKTVSAARQNVNGAIDKVFGAVTKEKASAESNSASDTE